MCEKVMGIFIDRLFSPPKEEGEERGLWSHITWRKMQILNNRENHKISIIFSFSSPFFLDLLICIIRKKNVLTHSVFGIFLFLFPTTEKYFLPSRQHFCFIALHSLSLHRFHLNVIENYYSDNFSTPPSNSVEEKKKPSSTTSLDDVRRFQGTLPIER